MAGYLSSFHTNNGKVFYDIFISTNIEMD